jgi:hypothetical protein
MGEKLMKYLLLLALTSSVFAFDHSHKVFTEVLQQNVSIKDKQSLVDYKGLKSSPGKLNGYLESLSSVKVNSYNSFSEDQKLAFLINAYNAFTLKLIIDNYPLESIKDIGSIFSGPWDKKFFTLLGKKKTLNNIEHGMIRKKFNEPRIHFAVNCASIGCPSLANTAFTADKLDIQLETAANNFMSNPTKNYAKDNTLYLSKIFDWYGKDFKEIGGFVDYAKKKLKVSGKVKYSFLDYSWKLNEQ